jgi:hypothetical protein
MVYIPGIQHPEFLYLNVIANGVKQSPALDH